MCIWTVSPGAPLPNGNKTIWCPPGAGGTREAGSVLLGVLLGNQARDSARVEGSSIVDGAKQVLKNQPLRERIKGENQEFMFLEKTGF